MKKKMLALGMAVGLTAMLLPATLSAENKYDDTAGHWAETAIHRWSEYELVEGTGRSFEPDRPLKRGELAKILSQLLRLKEEGALNPFVDAPNDAWYTPYLLQCYTAGILTGNDHAADPEAVVTRQEAMTLLGRALSMEPAEKGDLSMYMDANAIADWAAPYVSAMTASGLVNGLEKGWLVPEGPMTRGAFLLLLDRAVEQYICTPGTYHLASDGVILIAAEDVTLKGKSQGDILITPAASDGEVIFSKATLTGTLTVQADRATLIKKNGTQLGRVVALGRDIITQTLRTEGVGSSGGGGSVGGTGKDDPTPNPDPAPVYTDLIVAEAGQTIDGTESGTAATYRTATVTAAVGDGTVTLKDLHIIGDLTICGGGAHSVELNGCQVDGKVIIEKAVGSGAELPRLALTGTNVSRVEILGMGGIVESTDGSSKVTGTVITKADARLQAGTVSSVEISEGAQKKVGLEITGTGPVAVAVNSNHGVAVTTEPGNTANVNVTVGSEVSGEVTVNGTTLCKVHEWMAYELTKPATATETGVRTYTCRYCGTKRDQILQATGANDPKAGYDLVWGMGDRKFNLDLTTPGETGRGKDFAVVFYSSKTGDELPLLMGGDYRWGSMPYKDLRPCNVTYDRVTLYACNSVTAFEEKSYLDSAPLADWELDQSLVIKTNQKPWTDETFGNSTTEQSGTTLLLPQLHNPLRSEYFYMKDQTTGVGKCDAYGMSWSNYDPEHTYTLQAGWIKLDPAADAVYLYWSEPTTLIHGPKNGYDLRWSIYNGQNSAYTGFLAVEVLPPAGEQGKSYGLVLYNSTTGETVSCNVNGRDVDIVHDIADHDTTFDRVKLYHYDPKGYTGKTPLADWELEKKIIMKNDQAWDHSKHGFPMGEIIHSGGGNAQMGCAVLGLSRDYYYMCVAEPELLLGTALIMNIRNYDPAKSYTCRAGWVEESTQAFTLYWTVEEPIIIASQG